MNSGHTELDLLMKASKLNPPHEFPVPAQISMSAATTLPVAFVDHCLGAPVTLVAETLNPKLNPKPHITYNPETHVLGNWSLGASNFASASRNPEAVNSETSFFKAFSDKGEKNPRALNPECLNSLAAEGLHVAPVGGYATPHRTETCAPAWNSELCN